MAIENKNSLAAAMLILSSLAYNVTSGPPATPGPITATSGIVSAKSHDASAGDLAPWETLSSFFDQRKTMAAEPPTYLISIVPDPIDTHLSLLFDRAIESTENAAGDRNYTFDRYWVPWRENPYNATDKPEVRAAQEDEKRIREKQPGLLLFRAKRDLVVFLVGETPTAGINSSQFSSDIQFIRTSTWSDPLDKKNHSTKEDHHSLDGIAISGPTFSGSLPSLTAAIGDATRLDDKVSFTITSGSTTDKDSQK